MTYVKKVQIFTADSAKALEKEVNSFLSKDKEIGFHIIDIQYQTICTRHDHAVYSCMVYYSDPVEDDDDK
ncbi:sporulation protein Cse60 [Treponema vincentii]|uniref:sporulation protein Cse60 n=1 Tax=Treponema vincentii TaxID=69710 RepID=UPI003D8F56F3